MTIQQLQQYPLGDSGIKIIDKENFRVYSVYALYGNGGFLLNKKNIPNSIVSPIDTLYAPVLYPISCLTREIEVYGERFVPMYRIGIYDPSRIDYLIEQIHTGMVEHIIITMLQSWFINYQGIEAVNPFDLEINPYK